MFDCEAGVGAEDGAGAGQRGFTWREIDRRMRSVARRRAALDAEESRLLVTAKRAEVHKHLGYGSFTEYLERVCGYAPTTARDRLRVAEAIERLPRTARALADGELSFSAVRELTRVVVPETEDAWLEAMAGCTVREIEDNVRGHVPGDLPDTRPDPDLMTRVMRLELTPQVYALFLEARRALERRAGGELTDAQVVAELCRSALAEAGDEVCSEPGYQVAITVCSDCRRGWHEAGSKSIELAPAAIERARCDAIELGRVDGADVQARVRTVPVPVRRAVLARDRHRCTVPGCRSARHVDLHHIVHWSQGGEHSLPNLTTLCGRHHDAVHDGLLRIGGVAGALVVTHADGRPYGAPPDDALGPATPGGAPDAADEGEAADAARALASDARVALTRLGYRRADATAAVAEATTHVGAGESLESLIRTALRYCPRIRSS